ncbi:MAG: ribonuclease HII [Armatimonadota bacterium]|nr:ribonuclease HII [Armatimonadota bacterium]
MTRSAGRPTLAALADVLREGTFDPTVFAADPRAGARALAARWVRRQARVEAERRRVAGLFAPERDAWAAGHTAVAGVDEVGRGPIAGPVVAAAVVFRAECFIPALRDSKQLRPADREAVYQAILGQGASVGIGAAEVWEIDRLNILGATRLAWVRALAALPQPPSFVLLDGNIPAPVPIPQRTIVHGDARCASIAAASVVAKVTRDRLMVALDAQYPDYGFARHKGYRTADHLRALRRHGPSPVHRTRYLPDDLLQRPLAPGWGAHE